MRTSRPISTISYNSTEFLINRLNELKQNKKISFWAFIHHLAEPDESKDEAGTKTHIHLYIEPSSMLQTDDLKQEFIEFDPLHPDKPFKTINFQLSKFGDWYMYGLHDRAYLAYKGLSRKYHYFHDEFLTDDYDNFFCLSRQINMLELTPYTKLIDAHNNGFTFTEYFKKGGIPLQQLTLYEKAWFLLFSDETIRNGRKNHPVLDSNNDLIYIDEKEDFNNEEKLIL